MARRVKHAGDAGGDAVTSGWRGLGVFWIVVLLVLGAGAGVLQALGPPPPRPVAASHPVPLATSAPLPPQPAVVVSRQPQIPFFKRPGRDTPGPIADPDPALLEPGPDGRSLPRIAADGRMPMQVYAAGFDYSSRQPRIGLVLAGIGQDAAFSAQAINDLPPGVTLAISPYAQHPEKLLEVARLAEHEYLLSLPMEPHAFPLNDPGPRALMTDLSSADNLKRLRWLLSRIAGYAGVTSALGGPLQGGRFASVPEQMLPVLKALAGRGLLYVDARPGQPPLQYVWSRDVDVVVDRPPNGIEGKLAELERIARNKGSALGLAVLPLPVTVQRISAWANGLQDRGFILAPVSALAVPPPVSGEHK